MGKKLTIKDFEERIKKIHGDKIDISEFDFTLTSKKGKCKCNICGNVWYTQANSLLLGHGCRKCYDKRNSENRVTLLDEVQKLIDDNNKGVKIIDGYTDTKHKCLVKCSYCGYEWKTLPRYLINGSGCPKCSNYKMNELELKEFLEKKFEGCHFSFENLNFNGLHRDVTVICDTHGAFKIKGQSLIERKTLNICPLCNEEKKKIKEEKKLRKKEEWILRKKNKEEKEKRKSIELEKIKEEKRLEKEKNLINELKCIHSEYDYGKVKYVDCDTKIIVTCKKHGDFEISIDSLRQGHGCSLCKQRSKKYITEEWVEKAMKKHSQFSYEKTKYVNKKTPLIVTCPIHGDIQVYPNIFLRQEIPCPKCRMQSKIFENNKKYWNKIKEIYQDRNYIILNENDVIQYNSKIDVKCMKHDFIFHPTVHNILLKQCGCPKCACEKNGVNKRNNIDDVKRRINEIHNNKYNLSLFTEYKNIETKIPIICPNHGLIYMTPHSLLAGQGCIKCGEEERGLKNRLTHDEFMNRVMSIHKGKKLDFSECKYVRYDDYVKVYCDEKDKNGNDHGYFNIKASKLLLGNGCSICRHSHLEQEINILFQENKLTYSWQHRFSWLGLQVLDFYIPEANIALECQGSQHYIPDFFKSKGVEYAEKKFKIIQERDLRKKKLCQENDVELVYYLNSKFLKYTDPNDKCFTSKEDLLNYIKSKMETNNETTN